MPFPLAHPAAILPLKKFCPQRLSFCGLVFGAVCPDSSYLFTRYHLDDFAHTPKGGIVYCLPVGLLMLGVFFGLRGWCVQFLPARPRAVFLPLCRQPAGPLLGLILSVLIGIATHLVWDTFTHTRGWGVDHMPWLEHEVFRLSYLDRRYQPPMPSFHVLRLCHLLSFVSTFIGCAVLAYAYQQWLSRADPSVGKFSRIRAWVCAGFAAGVVMPVDVLHYLASGRLVLGLVALSCLGLIAGFVWWVGRPRGMANAAALGAR